MRRLFQFLTRRDGSIAVEFAFVAPVMIGLFFGLNELALALGAKADVVNLTAVGSDLVSQKKTATTADMTNVFSALSAMLYPYAVAGAQITISSVIDNNTATGGTIAWSCAQGVSPRAQNSVYTFPPLAQGVITQGGGGSVIMAEVTYIYNMPFTVTLPGIISLTGPYTMTSVFYSKPRRSLQIPLNACP